MNKNTIKGVVLAAAIVSILSIFYTPISVFGDIIYNAKVVKQLWYPIGLASFILIIISLVYTSKLLVEQPELKVSWRLLLISLILQFSFAILYLILFSVLISGGAEYVALLVKIFYVILLIALEICTIVALWILWVKIKANTSNNQQQTSPQNDSPTSPTQSNIN